MEEEMLGEENKEKEDIIIIEKYAIPFDPREDKRVLKYAVPKIISPPENSIKKYAVPEIIKPQTPPVNKYGVPVYENNPPVAKYALPDIEKYPLLKYAAPYFPPQKSDNENTDNTENIDKNPWK